MNLLARACLVAALALPQWATAGDSTDVGVTGVLMQIQSGNGNKQYLDLGSINGGQPGNRTTVVRANSVQQIQSGANNVEILQIGTITGNATQQTNVVVGTIVQTQSGNGQTNRVRIGNRN